MPYKQRWGMVDSLKRLRRRIVASGRWVTTSFYTPKNISDPVARGFPVARGLEGLEKSSASAGTPIYNPGAPPGDHRT